MVKTLESHFWFPKLDLRKVYQKVKTFLFALLNKV